MCGELCREPLRERSQTRGDLVEDPGPQKLGRERAPPPPGESQVRTLRGVKGAGPQNRGENPGKPQADDLLLLFPDIGSQRDGDLTPGSFFEGNSRQAPKGPWLGKARGQATQDKGPCEAIEHPSRGDLPPARGRDERTTNPPGKPLGNPVSSSVPVEALPQEALNIMVAKMVKCLLRKYRANEPTSYAELLNTLLMDNPDHYPVVFCQAIECILLVFGVDVKEVDPRRHIYIMVPNLGLTCDAMQRGGQGLPKAGLLVVVLTLILQNRDHSPEEEIWEALNKMGLYVGREHSIFGEPRELLTQVWVREGYLKYRQMPNSDPARYEFLWGPWAFLETSKEKFMEYLLRVNRRAFRSFPLPSAEDFWEEEEGAPQPNSTRVIFSPL
ncbi:melanoma-associated antigen 9-like [Odocoileus virginianus]|uniref:Melanoma-associated antigen 9-like n=1 Tax=Odocoileus virginianus TaxID=9874 RepID=A0ABM4HT53_ODOVR